MHTLKHGLEKPALIWVLIAAVYIGIFWMGPRHAPITDHEQTTLNVIAQFAESSFPPRISLVREVPDWGHLGFYGIYGRLHSIFKGDLEKLRLCGLLTMLAAFFVFIRLGFLFTYRNRLNPLWVSLAVVVLAANPYAWGAAFHVSFLALLLFWLLLAMYCFEKEAIGWAAVFISGAVLIDWRALLLALAFVITRVTGESSRLLRPERMIAFILPFFIGALPLLAWEGIVPQGEATEWLHLFRERASLFRIDGFFYCIALLPIYGVWFSWSWAIRARTRALAMGAIIAVVMVLPYFLFPIRFDPWSEIKFGTEVPLGLIDQGALLVAGQYKNLVLFIPWLAGAFLFAELILMDVLDRSRWLRYFIILFFAVQPFLIGVGDEEFLIVVPALLLLSLSESLVGEEGKLA